ncbi:MAG: HAD-IC family P-type ATPase [Chloroflexota bacterium]
MTALVDAHALPAGDVAVRLGVDPAVGLAVVEAERRAQVSGPNVLEAERGRPVWRMVLEAATEPFVLLLLAAGALAIILGEVRDGALVLLALLPIVGADVVTEYRGERALEALRGASAPASRVRRGGTVVDVATSGLVPGEVVLLRTGDVVPADLRLWRVDGLLVDRSALTGESVPEPGRVAPDAGETGLASRRSIAYAGTCIVGGRGEGIVVAIGGATEVGRIAGSLARQEHRRSPVQRELDRLVKILLGAALALIAFVTIAGFVRGRTLGENLLAGISAAIAAIPEEPPVLLAVVLGLGAYRLLRRGVLVRRLNAEETLGAVDLIVTDKTGTLTRNRLEIASLCDRDGPIEEPDRRRAMLVDALRAEDDAWHLDDGVVPGSFTAAIGRAIAGEGGEVVLSRGDLLDAVAAGDGSPIARTRARRDGGIEELALGAPEAVLALTGTSSDEGWLPAVEAGAEAGERLVLLARRSDGGPWQVLGLIGFADPLREGVREALGTARRAGIQTLVVTGDHPRTAAAIARAAGLDFDRVVTGEQLADWSDERLARELGDLHIVARSTPDQKERIVRAAKEDGRIVAVTGDGVNDAPALHGADVAVAMGSGTAVAREASDLVLGDDSFATLMYALDEGRRIVDNIQKGLVFLVSTHVALLGFLLIATLAGFDQPLLPIQILWLELFIDLSTSIAFEREPPEPDLMTRPPRPAGRPLLDNGLLARLTVAGGYSAMAALFLMANHGGGFEHARWLAYTALVVGQAVRAYANRSIRNPVHRLRTNGFLAVTCLVVVAVQAVIPYVPPLAATFRATPLEPLDWALVAAVALLPALLGETIRTLRPGSRWIA